MKQSLQGEGTYSWSESGKQLLANIYKLIEDNSSPEGLAHAIIQENPQFFHNYEDQWKSARYFRVKIQRSKTRRMNYHWCKEDIFTVLNNLHLSNNEIRKLIPHRSLRSIRDARYRYNKFGDFHFYI